MKYLYIRNHKQDFCSVIKLIDYDNFCSVSRLEDKLTEAIILGYAIYNDWVFSCWDELSHEL